MIERLILLIFQQRKNWKNTQIETQKNKVENRKAEMEMREKAKKIWNLLRLSGTHEHRAQNFLSNINFQCILRGSILELIKC